MTESALPKEPSKPRKVEVVEEVAKDSKRSIRETWEHPTTQRFVRNTVKCGIIGTAYTAVDEVLAWGQDKSR